MEASYRFTVSGRVQGVRYRQSAAEQALALGIRGWVCNRPDGAVEGFACGAPQVLESFRQWLERGPPAARVSHLLWESAVPESHAEFVVRR